MVTVLCYIYGNNSLHTAPLNTEYAAIPRTRWHMNQSLAWTYIHTNATCSHDGTSAQDTDHSTSTVSLLTLFSLFLRCSLYLSLQICLLTCVQTLKLETSNPKKNSNSNRNSNRRTFTIRVCVSILLRTIYSFLPTQPRMKQQTRPPCGTVLGLRMERY